MGGTTDFPHYQRIVDLMLPLVPGAGDRPLKIERGRTEELTVHEPVDHPWYIMHRVETISHIGTHIEAPYHCFEHGRDLAGIPLGRLVGEAVILDLGALPLDSVVGAPELAGVAEAAGGIRRDDIVFLRTGFATRRDAPEYAHRPSLTAGAMTYLVERGAKLVGTDLSGLEGPLTPGHLDCHLVLLGHDIPFIETWPTSTPSAARASSSAPCRSRSPASTPSRCASSRSSEEVADYRL